MRNPAYYLFGGDLYVFCPGATGHYRLSMYYFLSNQGYLVHVINPIQYDAARNLYIYENRTNCEDTSILADLLQMNQTEETFMVSEAVLKLQILS